MQRFNRSGAILVSSFLAAGLLACNNSSNHKSAAAGTTATPSTTSDAAGGQTASAPAAGQTATAATAAAATAAQGAIPAAGTLADLSSTGLPIYPTVFESAWTGEASTDKEAARIGQMSSHDSFDTVYAWYRQHMPAGTEPEAAAASNHTTDEGDRMAVFQIGETSDARMSRVMLLRGKNDGYTIINLASHVTK
jgi:hypothetical protein